MNTKLINLTKQFFKLVNGDIKNNNKNIDKIFSKNSKIMGTYSNDVIEKKDFQNYINKIKDDDIFQDNIFNSYHKLNDITYVNNCYIRWISKSRPVYKNRITFVYTYYGDIEDFRINQIHSSKLPFDE